MEVHETMKSGVTRLIHDIMEIMGFKYKENHEDFFYYESSRNCRKTKYNRRDNVLTTFFNHSGLVYE